MKRGTAKKTTTRAVKEKIRGHILEHYSKDFGYDDEPVEALKSEMEAVGYGNMSDYEAIKEIVNGGKFLIYHHDVKDFLNGLNINTEGKEYSDTESWELYKHLIAREGVRLIEG